MLYACVFVCVRVCVCVRACVCVCVRVCAYLSLFRSLSSSLYARARTYSQTHTHTHTHKLTRKRGNGELRQLAPSRQQGCGFLRARTHTYDTREEQWCGGAAGGCATTRCRDGQQRYISSSCPFVCVCMSLYALTCSYTQYRVCSRSLPTEV